jgi:hypothetical protein
MPSLSASVPNPASCSRSLPQIWLGAAVLAAAAFHNLSRPPPFAGQPRPATNPLPALKQGLLSSLRVLASAAGAALTFALFVARGLLLGTLRVLGAVAAATAMVTAAVGQLLFSLLRAAAGATVAALVAVAGVAGIAASDVRAVLMTVREELLGAGRLRGRPVPAAPVARRAQQPAAAAAPARVTGAEAAWTDPRAVPQPTARAPAPPPARAAQAPSAGAQGRPAPSVAPDSRMSDAELQKHLAAIKGESPKRTAAQVKMQVGAASALSAVADMQGNGVRHGCMPTYLVGNWVLAAGHAHWVGIAHAGCGLLACFGVSGWGGGSCLGTLVGNCKECRAFGPALSHFQSALASLVPYEACEESHSYAMPVLALLQPAPRPPPENKQPGGDPFLHSKYGMPVVHFFPTSALPDLMHVVVSGSH